MFALQGLVPPCPDLMVDRLLHIQKGTPHLALKKPATGLNQKLQHRAHSMRMTSEHVEALERWMAGCACV